ncbi:MAG: hypothetical protein OSB21_13900, partial [Myxococcota bacterium]|nr:hypothetical protein [Myxococcota bacterium]
MINRAQTFYCSIALLGALAQAGCTADRPDAPLLPSADAGPLVADAGVVSHFEPDALSTCGDGVVQAHERCDDGNRLDDDGCNGYCGIGAVQLAVGRSSSCARTASKQVYCWGMNNKAQLGLSDRQNRDQATLVPGVEGAIDLGAGIGFYCALMETGRVTCWGDSSWGALGFGSGPSNYVPRLVEGLFDAVALGVGFSHSCAVRVGGELVCWGRDSSAINAWSPRGQASLRAPLQVPELPPMASVAPGWYYACALSSQGALYCWASGGSNVHEFARGAPHIVPELPLFSRVFGIGQTLCALTPDGETWCGGLTQPREGVGVRLVEGLQNVAAVVGPLHPNIRRCARLTSGDVRCWSLEEETEKLELGERVRDFQVSGFLNRFRGFQIGGLKSAAYWGCWLTESGKVLCNGG